MTKENLETYILEWWKSFRPTDWSEAEHIKDPTIRTWGVEERRLAKLAGMIAEERLIDNNNSEKEIDYD
jgi:hypothetical protein